MPCSERPNSADSQGKCAEVTSFSVRLTIQLPFLADSAYCIPSKHERDVNKIVHMRRANPVSCLNTAAELLNNRYCAWMKQTTHSRPMDFVPIWLTACVVSLRNKDGGDYHVLQLCHFECRVGGPLSLAVVMFIPLVHILNVLLKILHNL